MGYSVGVNILHSGFNEGRLREEKIMGHGAACELGQAGFHTISRGVFFLNLCKCGLKRPGNPEDTLNDSR